jgi:methylglutaconyl-CoA hydratase/polyketide biosynthesis enoyl-CoA hydratase PksH
VEELVRYRSHAGVAEIELATRACGNSITPEAAARFDASIMRANEDPDCRVVVITSEGPKFCTGMDLSRVSHGGREFASGLLRICESSKPFIANLEGDAIAGGLGIVAACDIVIARPDVRVALTEAIVGMVPFVISPFLLRRMTPGALASLALSTRHLSAEEALHRGLVDEIGDNPAALNRQLDRLHRCSPQALERIKRAGAADLRIQVEVALKELEAWLEQPELRSELSEFANGFAPSWFKKYRPAGSAA